MCSTNTRAEGSAEQGFVPSAAAILADWGADVVKVERPTGDPLRHYAKLGVVPDVEGFNILFEQFNRNKRSVAIDLRDDEGRAALDGLIAWADVFVTSFLPSARGCGWRTRRHLGGEPTLRLRHRIGPGARGARRRPGRVRRGVVLGTRRARAHADPDGRAPRHATRPSATAPSGALSPRVASVRALVNCAPQHRRGVGRRRVVARRRGLDARRRPRHDCGERRRGRAALAPVRRSAAPC